jgi:hypothetical protein
VKLVGLSGRKGTKDRKEINELEANTNCKDVMDNYRGTNKFLTGYQTRTELVTQENGIKGLRQTETHITEP